MAYKYKYDNAKHRSQSEKDTCSTFHIQNMVTFSTVISYFHITSLKSVLLMALAFCNIQINCLFSIGRVGRCVNMHKTILINSHADVSGGARGIIFGRCLRLYSYLMYSNSEGSDSPESSLLADAISSNLWCTGPLNMLSWDHYWECFHDDLYNKSSEPRNGE